MLGLYIHALTSLRVLQKVVAIQKQSGEYLGVFLLNLPDTFQSNMIKLWDCFAKAAAFMLKLP